MEMEATQGEEGEVTHLPECPESNVDWLANWWDRIPCICDMLRACEQRVLNAAREAVAAAQDDILGETRNETVLAAIDALKGEANE